jgi:hypothetical protein
MTYLLIAQTHAHGLDLDQSPALIRFKTEAYSRLWHSKAHDKQMTSGGLSTNADSEAGNTQKAHDNRDTVLSLKAYVDKNLDCVVIPLYHPGISGISKHRPCQLRQPIVQQKMACR